MGEDELRSISWHTESAPRSLRRLSDSQFTVSIPRTALTGDAKVVVQLVEIEKGPSPVVRLYSNTELMFDAEELK